MNRYARLTLSTSIMIALHIGVGFMLFSIWTLISDPSFVAINMLDEELRQEVPETNLMMAGELSFYFESAFMFLLLWSGLLSFIWLLRSSMASLERPGQARGMRWLWWLLMVVGITGSTGIFLYNFVEIPEIYAPQTDYLSPHLRIPLTAFWGVLFFLFYFVCGSFFATPKISRTAVPLSSRILHS